MKLIPLLALLTSLLPLSASQACSLDFDGMQTFAQKIILKGMKLPANTPVKFKETLNVNLNGAFQPDLNPGTVIAENVMYDEIGVDDGVSCPDEIVEIYSVAYQTADSACVGMIKIKQFAQKWSVAYRRCEAVRNSNR